MVSKKKQKRSPKKSAHNEDVYLDDLQVEIKQEEELIIEDADQQHVQWRFIGMDDDVNEEEVNWEEEEFQQVYFQNQFEGGNQHNHSYNTPLDEVIEISDDDEKYTYVGRAGEAVVGDGSCEVLITNEPIQDSLIEANSLHNQSSSTIDVKNVDTSASWNNATDKDGTINSGKINDTKATEDVQKHISGNDIEKYRCTSHEQATGDVDYLNVRQVNELMCRKLIKMACHICSTTFQHNVYSWFTHIKQMHPKSLREMPLKYKPYSDFVVICKLCKIHVTPKINHTVHYITRHLEPKPHVFLCTFCNYADFSLTTLQNHQVEKHPTVISKREKCPKCDETFKDDTALEYHFMSVHIREFNAKHVYECHLCHNAHFESSKNKLYGHLINQHKLDNWKILNFRKIDNGAYLSCTKCYKIFIKTNVQHLLGHYLTHEDKCTWSCKFCKGTNHFKDWPVPHLCPSMKKFYEEKCKGNAAIKNENGVSNVGEPNDGSIQENQGERSVSWTEFEAYIEHVCPFCNEGFDKFENWRLHVRELHHIHTLEGLNMTIIPDEDDKLICLQCKTHVTKSAVELHKHRFQHLPYEPYKCRHCRKCLSTYNKALFHVQKSCQDNDGKCVEPKSIHTVISKPESLMQQEAAAIISISCTLCNNKRFSDFTQISKHITNVHDNFEKYFTKASKERSRSCKICQTGMKHNKINELICHYLQHLDERPFKCQKCSRSYPTYRTAMRHVQSYHLDNTSADIIEYIQNSSIKHEEETKPQSKSPSTQPTPIPPPPSTTRSPPSIQQPTTLKPVSTSLQEDNGISKLPCGLHVVEYTNIAFKTFEQYITYACPECNESFSSLINWEAHVNSKHTFFKSNSLRFIAMGKGKSKCLDCDTASITRISKLQNHKLTHMPHRPFVCVLCLSRYTAIASLYKHLRSAHFFPGSFQCDLCSKALSTDFERLEHVKKVHPSKKWPNNMCTICFTIIDDMDDHLSTNHLTHQRKYRCENCGIYFEHSKDLETHIKKKHFSATKEIVNVISPEKYRTEGLLGKRKLQNLSQDDISNNTKKICSTSVAPIRSRRK